MATIRTAVPLLAIGMALALAACGSSTPVTAAPSAAAGAPSTATAATTPSSATPSTQASAAGAAAATCTAPAAATMAQTEGPYYRAGAPEAADLVTNAMTGTRLTLTGAVVDTTCTPIADAKVEIWQADAAGQYDNGGYTLRGWVTTDAQGRFTFHTVVPGEYPGRTEHIHVKVTPPGGSTLTTQLYFPGTVQNDADGIFDPSMLLAITRDGDALVGTYTFVIAG